MKPEIKAEWIKRLTSGDYLQGSSHLRETRPTDKEGVTQDYYCCLGVLCEMAAEAGVGRWNEEGDITRAFLIDYDDSFNVVEEYTGLPPYEVLDWAGIENRSRVLTFTHKAQEWHPAASSNLVQENDDGVEFPVIAQYIKDYF